VRSSQGDAARRNRFLRVGTVVVLLVAGFATGTGTASGQTTDSRLKYTARISRTSYGVPHNTAANFASLGFGRAMRRPKTTSA